MVKMQDQGSAGSHKNQGENAGQPKANRIGPSTAYEYCRERLSPFGGLLGLVKFLDLVRFKEIFEGFYKPPERMPDLGHYNMVLGILLLLFIGFTRVWRFLYLQFDAVVCGIFNRVKLPYVTTYWRYVNSLGINQGMSLLVVMSALRERVWQRKFGNNYAYFQIVMLAYNIWWSFKMLAAHGMRETERHEPTPEMVCKAQQIVDHTIRIGRLKLLFIAAKVATHSGTTEVKYSRHDSRVAGLFRFMEYLDKRRHQARPWLSGKFWKCKHLPFWGIQRSDAFG